MSVLRPVIPSFNHLRVSAFHSFHAPQRTRMNVVNIVYILLLYGVVPKLSICLTILGIILYHATFFLISPTSLPSPDHRLSPYANPSGSVLLYFSSIYHPSRSLASAFPCNSSLSPVLDVFVWACSFRPRMQEHLHVSRTFDLLSSFLPSTFTSKP